MENEEVIGQTGVILRNLMVEGILSLTESTKTDTIEIIRWRNGVKEREEKKNLQGSDSCKNTGGN